VGTGRLFTYNPSHTVISGAEIKGDLSVQTGNITNYGSLNWFMGPDEDIVGYYIAGPYVIESRPQFWSPELNTEASVLDLLKRNFGVTLGTGQEAINWLDTNGYWYNFNFGGLTTTTTTILTPTTSTTTTTTLAPTTSTTTTTLAPTTTTTSTTIAPTTTTTTTTFTTTTTTSTTSTTTTTLTPTTSTTTTTVAHIDVLYTTSGTWYSSGITSITVECWGGGGSGAGATTNQYTGGGGGGAYTMATISVNSDTLYTVTVGALADGTLADGTVGNPSWFGSTTTVFAAGGDAGLQNSAGSGGLASAGYPISNSTRYSGGSGYYVSNITGGGGGGAGSTGPGGDATSATGGLGTAENGGNGGTGVSNPADATSAAGSNYGGGGGGIRRTNGSRYGGNGAQGLVRITYYI
jgi:hypothetical protein